MELRTPEEMDVACHASIFVREVSDPGFEDVLRIIATAGFRRVVLPPFDPAKVDLGRLREQLSEAGLNPITTAGQSPDANLGASDSAVRGRGVASLWAAADLTASIGGDQMNGVPYGLLEHASGALSKEEFRRIAREVGSVADYAAEREVTMTFEVLNRYETNVVNTAEQAMSFIEASGSDALFVHLDTFHMAVEEGDIGAAIAIALPKLRYLELGQSGRGLFGQGAIDVAGIVRQAIDRGYTGRWGIEAFSRDLMSEAVADMLAVWRTTFEDATDVVESALAEIRHGWKTSEAGRRAMRLARVGGENHATAENHSLQLSGTENGRSGQ